MDFSNPAYQRNVPALLRKGLFEERKEIFLLSKQRDLGDMALTEF